MVKGFTANEGGFTVSSEHSQFCFDASIAPVLSVAPPATITFQTSDATYQRLAAGETVTEIGFQNFNAVTGAVEIVGAEPGDALTIEILDIKVATAWTAWLPGLGTLGDMTSEPKVRKIPLENGLAVVNERLSVPLDPMIGCIGVAPSSGRSSTLRPAYPWGGNMDLRELTAGATLYLPVQVPGALLSLGDLHAAMGQGEPTSVSLEAAGSATVLVSVDRTLSISYPRIRIGSTTYLVAVADEFREARSLAMDLAFTYLTRECGLESFDAYAYASARVGLRFGGPASAVVLAVVPDP